MKTVNKFTSMLTILRLVKPVHIPKLLAYMGATGLRRLTGVSLLESVNVAFSGIWLHLRTGFPSGLRFIQEILDDNEYANFPTEGFPPGAVLFDVGANIGLVTMQKCAAAPHLQVHSIEPHPSTFALLRENISINGLDNRVTAANLAISDHPGTITMLASDTQNMAVAVSGSTEKPSGAKEIPCTTLDDYCRQQNLWPAFLKVDVEGHEVEALRGATQMLERVSEIIIETHSIKLHADCRDILLGQNFVVTGESHLLFGKRK